MDLLSTANPFDVEKAEVKQVSLYEIKTEANRVYLRISPPYNGVKASLDEIQEELHDLDVDYLPEKLLRIFEKQLNSFEVLCELNNREYQFMVEVARDGQTAQLTVVPPSDPIEDLTPELMERHLISAGVLLGIDREALKRIAAKGIYHEPTLVATGQLPFDGKDGYVQLVFDKEDTKERDESLQIDHREMRKLKNCKIGDVLVKLVPPTKGRDGYTVKGKDLKARVGKKCRLFPGRNTRFNDDRTQIVANKAGFVVVMENYITIENVYRVEEVSAATGNLRFDGIIFVDGNVEDGYTVEASVRIDVKGTVGKATLVSNGDVRVAMGMMGATVRSGRNISAKFVSDSNLTARNDVLISEYILNSDISAGSLVHVTTREGFFSGGTVHAGNFINIPNCGSKKIGVSTVLEVGIDIVNRKRFTELEARMEINYHNFAKLKKNLLILQMAREKRGLLPADHEATFEKISLATATLAQSMRADLTQWRELVDNIMRDRNSNGGIVFVEGTTHPGTTFKLKRLAFNVKSPLAEAAVLYQKGKIQVRSFNEIIPRYRRFFYSQEMV